METTDIGGHGSQPRYKQLRCAIIMGHRAPGRAAQRGRAVPALRERDQPRARRAADARAGRAGVHQAALGYFHHQRHTQGAARHARTARRSSRWHRSSVPRPHHRRAVERAGPRAQRGYTGDDDESYDRYTDENRHFHHTLGQASGNAELAEMLGRLHDRLARFMVMRHAGSSQPETHARIVAAQAPATSQPRQAMLDEITESRLTILDCAMQGDGAPWQIRASEVISAILRTLIGAELRGRVRRVQTRADPEARTAILTGLAHSPLPQSSIFNLQSRST